jgi:hypothetical protein
LTRVPLLIVSKSPRYQQAVKMGKPGYHDLERGTPLVSRGWHIAKIVLRVFSILLCCGAIGLEVPTALKYKEEADRLQLEYSTIVDIAITVGPPVRRPRPSVDFRLDHAHNQPAPDNPMGHN